MVTSYLIAPLEPEEFDRLLSNAKCAMGRSNCARTKWRRTQLRRALEEPSPPSASRTTEAEPDSRAG
jgi:hypothetical protein